MLFAPDGGVFKNLPSYTLHWSGTSTWYDIEEVTRTAYRPCSMVAHFWSCGSVITSPASGE
jgi:hypothetical protein